MPWKDAHQRINSSISSSSDSQHKEAVKLVLNTIMKETADSDIVLSTEQRYSNPVYRPQGGLLRSGRLYTAILANGVATTREREQQIRQSYNIRKSRLEALLDSSDFRAMVNFSNRNAAAPQPAPQPTKQASNAPQMEAVQPSRTTVNRPTEKVINVKTATVENLASMMNNMRKNMQKRLKTTADVGHANRDFFAGILRRKDA